MRLHKCICLFMRVYTFLHVLHPLTGRSRNTPSIMAISLFLCVNKKLIPLLGFVFPDQRGKGTPGMESDDGGFTVQAMVY